MVKKLNKVQYGRVVSNLAIAFHCNRTLRGIEKSLIHIFDVTDADAKNVRVGNPEHITDAVSADYEVNIDGLLFVLGVQPPDPPKKKRKATKETK